MGYVNSTKVIYGGALERKYVFRDVCIKADLDLMFLVKKKIMADSVKIQFVDDSEFQNDGKWYFYIDNSQLALFADVSGNAFPFPSKTKNNFRGIDISQPTPSMSLSVPSFSLGLN